MQKSIKQFPKERYPELEHPGDAEPELGLPGSIEQHLDMCEEGSLRGDELLHQHGVEAPGEEDAQQGEPLGVDVLMARNPFEIDMAEESREGSEMTGDEHSCGLLGGDSMSQSQPHQSSGLPGEQTRQESFFEAHDQTLSYADLSMEEAEPPVLARRQAATPPPVRKKIRLVKP